MLDLSTGCDKCCSVAAQYGHSGCRAVHAWQIFVHAAGSRTRLRVQVRRDWRSLQASVQVQASAQPDKEYADLTCTTKQLNTDLGAAHKQLELDSAAAERFHTEVRALTEATEQVLLQLKANTVRREIEGCRV
jgi:hypothetical protein